MMALQQCTQGLSEREDASVASAYRPAAMMLANTLGLLGLPRMFVTCNGRVAAIVAALQPSWVAVLEWLS